MTDLGFNVYSIPFFRAKDLLSPAGGGEKQERLDNDSNSVLKAPFPQNRIADR
jgi:hypothetical protein